MRHGNKNNALGRKASHRQAMLSNMACSLIQHKRITTTVAKAKELRKFVEPLITRSKTDSTHSRRMVFSTLNHKETVAELFRDVAPKVAERNGGYTRIIKLGTRLGDSAEMAMIELVDFNELMLNDKTSKTRRSRRSKKKSTDTPENKAEATVETKSEATSETPEAAAETQPEQPEQKENTADNSEDQPSDDQKKE